MLKTEYENRLLAVASAESRRRIRCDHDRVALRLKPLLAFIAEHLFDPRLSVTYLKKRCGVRDNSLVIVFHSAIGRPPRAYIEDRRFETAKRLLRSSELKVWRLAELLGYASLATFSRAFTRWSGQPPTRYRRHSRRSQEEKSVHGSPQRGATRT